MSEQVPAEGVGVRCPECGAPLVGGSWYCGGCGRMLAPVPPTALGEATRPVPATPPVGAAPGMPAAVAGAQRRCAWCGAANVTDAERCAACGAVFAAPEATSAWLAEAQARLRQAEDDLNARRLRRGWGRFFTSR